LVENRSRPAALGKPAFKRRRNHRLEKIFDGLMPLRAQSLREIVPRRIARSDWTAAALPGCRAVPFGGRIGRWGDLSAKQ
jgi:hypothetical protein